MKKLSKSGAFILALCAILGIYGAGLAFGMVDSAGTAIGGVVALSLAFIGGQVADNGVKGKFYRAELDKKGDASCG